MKIVNYNVKHPDIHTYITALLKHSTCQWEADTLNYQWSWLGGMWTTRTPMHVWDQLQDFIRPYHAGKALKRAPAEEIFLSPEAALKADMATSIFGFDRAMQHYYASVQRPPVLTYLVVSPDESRERQLAITASAMSPGIFEVFADFLVAPIAARVTYERQRLTAAFLIDGTIPESIHMAAHAIANVFGLSVQPWVPGVPVHST